MAREILDFGFWISLNPPGNPKSKIISGSRQTAEGGAQMGAVAEGFQKGAVFVEADDRNGGG